MKQWLALTILVLAAFLATGATAQDNRFKLYGAVNWVSPTGDEEVDIGMVVDEVEAGDELGYSVGFEFRFGKWAGLEFDYLHADHDIEFGGTDIGETTMSPITGSLNFHLIHTRFVDFYFGPSVAWVSWDDIDFDDGSTSETDDEFAYGAQVGLDISLIKRLAIVTGLRYIKLDITDETDGTEVPVDPIFAKVGLAFRW